MAFKLYSTDDGMVPAWEYLPCEAITPKVGLCLNLDATSGQLEVSETPKYICMRTEKAAVTAGTILPVVKIQRNQIWETTLDGVTAYKAGETADVDTTGLLVDGDSSTDDVFLLSYLEGNTAGSVVRGRFVK